MKKAYFSAILYAFLIGFSFMATKITVTTTTTETVLAHRFLLGALFFIIYRLVTRTKSSITKVDLKTLLPLSISYPILYFLVQALALSKIGSGEVGIIFAGSPAIALFIASVFLKEKSTSLQKLGILLSITGVVLIFVMQGIDLSGDIWGYIFAILAALVFAIYNTHARFVIKKYSFFEVTETLLYVGAIFYNVIALFKGLNYYIEPFNNTEYIWAILYIGTFASVLASLAATYALQTISASQLTIFSNLATLITILAGVFILGESMYWYHYLSTILIILGVMLANRLIKRAS